MHGGKTAGAPKGNANAFKHGRYSADAIAARWEIADLLRAMKHLVNDVSDNEFKHDAEPAPTMPINHGCKSVAGGTLFRLFRGNADFGTRNRSFRASAYYAHAAARFRMSAKISMILAVRSFPRIPWTPSG